MEGKAGQRRCLVVASIMSPNLTLFRAPKAGPSMVRVKGLRSCSKPRMVDKPGRRSPPHFHNSCFAGREPVLSLQLDCHPERSGGSQIKQERARSVPATFLYEAYSRRKPTSIVV